MPQTTENQHLGVEEAPSKKQDPENKSSTKEVTSKEGNNAHSKDPHTLSQEIFLYWP